ncbi:MAG: hypothetical protein ACREOP_05050, partial [Thermodesulfobacteriota bacterium]
GGIFGGLGKSFGALGSLFGIGSGAVGGTLGAIDTAFAGMGFGGSLIGITGFGATLSAAIPAIGAIISAALIAIPLIIDAFKKSAHYAFSFESVGKGIEERAAQVSEFLDADFFSEEIFKTLSSHGGKGAFSGKAREELKKAIQKTIESTIESIQAIIFQLPSDMAAMINEALLNTEVDIESKIGRSNLLGFDAKGAKEIEERLEKFFGGDLQARFITSIREFFEGTFIQLGVAADKANEMIDKLLADMQAAGSPEERAQIGADFLELFDVYVDVFNLINDGVQGVFEKAMSDIRALSASLDIETANGIPSLEQIQTALEDLFETGQLTAETAQKFMQLRQAVIELTLGLAQSISSIASTIAQLNTDILALGGSAVDIGGDIREAIGQLQGLLDNEALSLDEREAILNELNGLTNQLAANELARQQAAAQAQINAQRNAINNQIQGLQRLKTVEAKKNQEALDALQEQLNLVQDLESLVESIQQNIQDLLFASGGPESVFERIARAQSEVSRLFSEIGSAGPEERAEIGKRLQDMLNELNTLRQEGFQAPSPESDALFRDIIGGLEKLEGMVEPARSSEAIQASIEAIQEKSQKALESIDKRIEAAQSKLSGLQTVSNQLTGKVADEIRALKESIREEFIKILEERLDQLGEVTDIGLGDILSIEEEQLVVLRSIAGALDAVPSMQHGGFVPPGRNTLAMLHGGSEGEVIIPRSQGAARGNVNVSLTLPPISFAPGQVINPNSFTKEIITSLHDRRITDEIVKIVRGRT